MEPPPECEVSPDTAYLCRFVLYYPEALLGEDVLEPDPGSWMVQFTCNAEEVLLGRCGDLEETLPRHLLDNLVGPALDTAFGEAAEARDGAVRILTGQARNLPESQAYLRGLAAQACGSAVGFREPAEQHWQSAGDAWRGSVGDLQPWPSMPSGPWPSPCPP